MKEFFYMFFTNAIYWRTALSVFLLLIFLIGHRILSRFMLKLVSRLEIKHTRAELSHLEALQKPFNHLFLIIGFYFALAFSPLCYGHMVGESLPLAKTGISIISLQFINKFYHALLTAYITWILYLLAHIYEEIFNGLNLKLPLIDNSLLLRFIARITRAVIIVIGSFISLSFIFKGLPSILTGVGIGGAALAFVAKDALSNVFSGVLLMLDKPFVIDDWIEIIGLEGIVEDISFRSTRLRTFTQGQVIIPNSQISNENLINWTRMKKRRVKFDLGVGYDTSIDDLNLCIEKIKHILSKDPDIEDDTYLVAFENFGDYALNIQILYYSMLTDYASYLHVKQRVNLELLKLCEDLGINIAFPTQTVYMQNVANTPQATN